MSDIPDDITKAARKVVIEDLGMDAPGALQNSYIDCIAEAILAERDHSRQLLSEAEKREREARETALEEAAKVAETFKRRRLGRDLSKAHFDPCGRWEGGEIYEDGKEKDLIALRIRALVHEPLSEPDLIDALSALQSEER